jgi:hypothetical protein
MLNGIIDLEVDYTTAKQVNGLNGLGTVKKKVFKRQMYYGILFYILSYGIFNLTY